MTGARVLGLVLMVVLAGAGCGDAGTGTTTTTEPPLPTLAVPPEIDLDAPFLLGADGLGAVPFGVDPDAAVAATAELLLMDPDEDSGWIDPFSEIGTCPGTEIRAVEFGDLTLLFTDAETQFERAGTRHFFSYRYRTGNRGPLGLVTAEGIGLGSRLEELQTAYGDHLVLLTDDLTAGGPRYEVTPDPPFGLLSGFVGGTGPEEPVLAIDGGFGCGERPAAT